MSCFSITSPRITETDDLNEYESLSESEKKAIHLDLLGGVCRTKETDEMKSNGALQMEAALELIPDNEKQAYLGALAECPELVRTESEPIRFLRSTETAYNPWEAASCLVKYWELRRAVFGDRGYRPLLARGNGALSAEAVAMLHTGIVSRLPNDENDRAVVYLDRSRFEATPAFRSAFLQVFMYMFSSVIDESEMAQVNGIVLLVLATRANVAKFDRKLSRMAMKILSTAEMPMRIRAIHVCTPMRTPPFGYILPVVRHIAGKYLRRRMIVHSGGDIDVLDSLVKHGMKKTNIPTSLAGTLNVDIEHRHWMTNRHQRDLNAG